MAGVEENIKIQSAMIMPLLQINLVGINKEHGGIPKTPLKNKDEYFKNLTVILLTSIFTLENNIKHNIISPQNIMDIICIGTENSFFENFPKSVKISIINKYNIISLIFFVYTSLKITNEHKIAIIENKLVCADNFSLENLKKNRLVGINKIPIGKALVIKK